MGKGNIKGRDVAEMELDKWFEILDVQETDRIDKEEGNDVMYEKVVKAIMQGHVQFDEESKLLIMKLRDPITKESGEVVLDELKFKSRYKAFELENNMKGVKTTEMFHMVRAYIATITGTSKSVLTKLENKDYNLAQAIYNLFTRGE